MSSQKNPPELRIPYAIVMIIAAVDVCRNYVNGLRRIHRVSKRRVVSDRWLTRIDEDRESALCEIQKAMRATSGVDALITVPCEKELLDVMLQITGEIEAWRGIIGEGEVFSEALRRHEDKLWSIVQQLLDLVQRLRNVGMNSAVEHDRYGEATSIVGNEAECESPAANGYVSQPNDPSVFVPATVILTDYSQDLGFKLKVKMLGEIIENFKVNKIRWSRPLMKDGKPNMRRRIVHLTDWISYLNRFSGRSSKQDDRPNLNPTEIERRAFKP